MNRVFADGASRPSTPSEDNRQTDQPAGGRTNGDAEHASPHSRGDLSQTLLRTFQEIWGSVESLVEVKSDRIRISLRRSIVRAVLGITLAVCTTLGLGAAALSVLRGARGGLTELWGGREWMGDLTGGLLAWALAAAAIAIHLRLSSRRELAGLRGKYERIRHRHDANPGTTAPAGNGGGVA